MAGENTYLESDGKSIQVPLLYEVGAGQLAVVKGWVGIVEVGGASGETVAMNIDQREYQYTVPAGLSVSWGQTVYIEIADLTGHVPDDSAYSTSAGAGKVAAFKATSDKDENNMVTGIQLPNVLS